MDPARCEDANITTELSRNVTPNSNGTPAELHFVVFFFNFCWAFSLQSMSSDIYFFLSHPWGCFLDLENCLILNARTVKFLISWTRSELNHSERIYQLMLTIRQRFPPRRFHRSCCFNIEWKAIDSVSIFSLYNLQTSLFVIPLSFLFVIT